MKYLDTLECWGQVFKICRSDHGYILWIHKHDSYYKLHLDHNEIKELSTFLQNFIAEDTDEKWFN
jgi:hypothetical protein